MQFYLYTIMYVKYLLDPIIASISTFSGTTGSRGTARLVVCSLRGKGLPIIRVLSHGQISLFVPSSLRRGWHVHGRTSRPRPPTRRNRQRLADSDSRFLSQLIGRSIVPILQVLLPGVLGDHGPANPSRASIVLLSIVLDSRLSVIPVSFESLTSISLSFTFHIHRFIHIAFDLIFLALPILTKNVQYVEYNV